MNHTIRYIYRILNYSEGTDIQLNTNVQLHLHGTVVNNAEDSHNLYTRNNMFGSEITIYETVYLFLQDVVAMMRFSNSALNDPSAKGNPFSGNQAIISSFLQLCVGVFSRRTL
jgi:hypothetical protein